MNLETYTEFRNEIETRLNIVDVKLNSFPKSSSGMVNPTKEYLETKRKFDLVFSELQTLNKFTSNNIKKQYSRNKRNW